MTSAEQMPAANRSADNPIRVGVLGARGRVGTEVCKAKLILYKFKFNNKYKMK